VPQLTDEAQSILHASSPECPTARLPQPPDYILDRSDFCRNVDCIRSQQEVMKIQILIITVLVSVMCWVFMFDVSRDAYREAHAEGIVPNLHIERHLHQLI
jgi:hypothetical protein